MTENIAIYVENHIKELGQEHESYLQDTPDFLRHIQQLNDDVDLSNNAMLVVIDVIGLYPNIPPSEGVKFVGDGLRGRPNSKVPAELIERLLQIILDYIGV